MPGRFATWLSKDDERALLWRSLRERGAEDQGYHARLPDEDVPPEVLLMLLGLQEDAAGYDRTELE